MVRFILGRAGSGKTARVIEEIRAACSDGAKIILLVPEQYSHTAERLLCERVGEHVSNCAEVMSFQRMADHVLMQAGGLARRVVDAGGRILLMRRALMQVKNELKVLGHAALRPEFLASLLDIAEEMKTCCVKPESLIGVGEGLLADKLYDIAKITAAYEGAFENGKIDPADKLKLAEEGIRKSGFFRGVRVWVDGYSGFTPQEHEILRLIAAQSDSFTVTLCRNDDPESESGAFSKSWETYSRIVRYAGDSEIISLAPGARYRAEELSFLEQKMFSHTAKFEKECNAIELYSASGAFDECSTAAALILKWVREENVRYRDIVVCARNFSEYAQTLSAVLERYDIPFYENHKQSSVASAPVAFVLSALNVIANRFRYEDMAAYLKTGLCGVRRKNLDRLEHYLYTWHVEGKLWSEDTPFLRSPSGRNQEISENDKKELEFLNRLRVRVREPLYNLKAAISENPTGRGFCDALFDFFEEVHLARRLSAKSELFRLRGDFERAEQYEQLWGILISAIESIARTLPEDRFTVSEFTKMFSLMLSQYEIGMIPTALDRVHIGGMERVCESEAARVIVLGAIDGRMPMHSESKGIFSDSERARLDEWGIELSDGAERRLFDEFRVIYTTFSAASEKLCLIVPQKSADGTDARESFMVTRLRSIFGLSYSAVDSPETYAVKPCFDLAACKTPHPWRAAAREYFARKPEYSERLALASRNARVARGPITDRENIDAIFGKTIRLSASRTDSFSSCRYQYFLKYGLHLHPKREARLDAPEIGTFLHEIMEVALKEIKALGGHRAVSEDKVLELCDIAIERFIAEKLGGFSQRTSRFKFMFLRLKQLVHAVALNTHRELCASCFEPIDFELHFSDKNGDLPALKITGDDFTVKLEGFVDRVDGYETDDTLYLRVVDYKTGSKDFKINEVLNGLNMQMLLYLFTLCDKGEAKYGKVPQAAGVLYLPAKDPVLGINGNESEEYIKSARDNALTRRGLLLDDPELCAGELFLPVRIKKDGDFDAKSSVTSREGFKKIEAQLEKILANIGSELHNGIIDANPYRKNAGETACDFCDMRGACHFDERAGDETRYLFAVRMEDI